MGQAAAPIPSLTAQSTYGRFNIGSVERIDGVQWRVEEVARQEVCDRCRMARITNTSVNGKLLLHEVGKDLSLAFLKVVNSCLLYTSRCV